jgi:hypothetical protein
MPMRLSKSKLFAYRQCARRLWLEVHRPELRADNRASLAAFAAGHAVGDIARRLYDPDGTGILLDPQADGHDAVLARSQALVATPQPIFEAGFATAGALSFADILLPASSQGKQEWRMVEVKSSTSIKDYQRDDAAIQSHVALAAGVPLSGIALALIDSNWVYPGGGDYRGLLVEQDLTAEAFARGDEVAGWVAGAHATAAQAHEPDIAAGAHCDSPYDCGFTAHCRSGAAQAEYPVSWLPQVRSKVLKQQIADGATDMRALPDALLSARQLRVKHHTLAGTTYFDEAGAAADLAAHGLPACFVDFETIAFAVPIWAGTRPFQMIPFQFSVHRLDAAGELAHEAFLDISGGDPSRAFGAALLAACGDCGPVYVYNAGFEKARMAELGERFADLRAGLEAICERVVDLLPVARDHYYHPSQQGSWSIKKVLPAVAPDLRYDQLDGVQDGGAAMTTYLEAIADGTGAARKRQIERQLLDYCHLDTLAMVRLWRFFTGRQA